MPLGKTDIVELLAAETETTKADASAAVTALLEIIQNELKTDGGKVTFPGFGTFSSTDRPEREGRNPSTGKAMTIAASTAVKFKVGATLKAAVNNK